MTQLLLPSGDRYTFESICAQARPVHERLFLRGTLPDRKSIAGWEYKGWNLSPTAQLIGIRRFTKGLQAPADRSSSDADLDGYNLWIQQRGNPSDTWVPSSPERHGFYKVSASADSVTDRRYPHALLLDYGRGPNPWTNPARFLRDFVVQVYPDDPTLLIGKAFVALGSARIFGGNFVMVRSAAKSDDRPLR